MLKVVASAHIQILQVHECLEDRRRNEFNCVIGFVVQQSDFFVEFFVGAGVCGDLIVLVHQATVDAAIVVGLSGAIVSI